jgi:antitoxin component YwqK of YwqJK toxin-antitoxin module
MWPARAFFRDGSRTLRDSLRRSSSYQSGIQRQCADAGRKMRSGHFAGGKQVGEWTTYDAKGKVVKVTKFSR